MNGIQLQVGPKTQNAAQTRKTGINKHPGIPMDNPPFENIAVKDHLTWN